MNIDDATAQRFWEKVDRSGDCWLWQAQRNGDGYGRFKVNRSKWYAHRVSYIMARGDIPDGLQVLHRCDTPACVNPAHLFLGTNLDNIQDRMAKGRKIHRRPISQKLTPEQVTEIRQRFQPGVVGIKQLMAEYGVSRSTIKQVVHYRTWKN